jgi:hypothetical protein
MRTVCRLCARASETSSVGRHAESLSTETNRSNLQPRRAHPVALRSRVRRTGHTRYSRRCNASHHRGKHSPTRCQCRGTDSEWAALAASRLSTSSVPSAPGPLQSYRKAAICYRSLDIYQLLYRMTSSEAGRFVGNHNGRVRSPPPGSLNLGSPPPR